MCLAVPMRVITINENVATVEIFGTQRQVRLDLIAPVPEIGNYVMVHAGFAINVIDESEAKITLECFKELLEYENEIPG
ncbi:HypC/HybG/HupF family hydrogenase formation chaperone [candidate division KSB1 bacterium]|nr:HypC/HybG/HupF family hydrogenase formation chaperone [candidate division KSB1 bacterium]